jgi:hypothetical protein
MSMTSREAAHSEGAAYGGLIDAIGGIATVVIAICGLAGIQPPLMAAIATTIFGIALLIQGGAMLSEYTQISIPAGAKPFPIDQSGISSLSAVFLMGAGGIVLGVLALLDINSAVLTPIAAIGFGTALVLSSKAVWHLYLMRCAALKNESPARFESGEILASEMASGSAGIQALAGLGAIVLGIIAVAGSPHDLILNLIALLVLGSSLILTGSSLSATVLSLTPRWSRS